MEEVGQASTDFVRDLSERASKRMEVVKKGTLVYVSNPTDADVITLQDALTAAGTVKSILKMGESYRVDYQDPKGAKKALEMDIEYNGNTLCISSQRPLVVLKKTSQKSIDTQPQIEPSGGAGISLAALAASNPELRKALLGGGDGQEEEDEGEQKNSKKNENHDDHNSSSSSSSSDEEDDRREHKKKKRKKKKKKRRYRSRSRDRTRGRDRSRSRDRSSRRKRHRSRSRDRSRRRRGYRSRSRDRYDNRRNDHRRRRSRSPRRYRRR